MSNRLSTIADDAGALKGIICPLLCLIVTVSFFSSIWDSDFFWHLATGSWIVENKALPDRDLFAPFVYHAAREAMILNGYWLTQVLYHFLYALGWGVCALAFVLPGHPQGAPLRRAGNVWSCGVEAGLKPARTSPFVVSLSNHERMN